MLVLVTYDIHVKDLDGERRLRRVAKQCVNYGVRVQNSVFECRVDAAQYTRLKHLIQAEMDEAKEKALNIALNKISGDWDKDKLATITPKK